MATLNFKSKSYADAVDDISIDVIFNGQTVHNGTIISSTDSSNDKDDILITQFTFDVDPSVKNGSFPMIITVSGTNGVLWFGELTYFGPAFDDAHNLLGDGITEELPIGYISNVTVDGIARSGNTTGESMGAWQHQVTVGSTLTCDVNIYDMDL